MSYICFQLLIPPLAKLDYILKKGKYECGRLYIEHPPQPTVAGQAGQAVPSLANKTAAQDLNDAGLPVAQFYTAPAHLITLSCSVLCGGGPVCSGSLPCR